ncbi:hydrogenase 2-specific chaperone [mine drainage metagenome]|uniref:Hydrogenase 2-specific chaperone n=1 Tax=mine drainage metagenome TaxID=410659 RepID=A0A1J5PKR5_9ZZZZ
MVITHWCMSVLLVPGSAEQWDRVGANQRRFVKFPAGDFAFLDSSEVELGDFQSCALFSPMDKFSTQSEALMTARASLIGLLSPPPTAQVEKAEAAGGQAPGLSRRGFLAFHKA